MLCCLNPACHNPPAPDGTKFCSNCGVPLVVLRNRYRPLKSLGGGGFGKTYLAEDIDKLNKKCVIKQFAPQVQGTLALQKATELFEQEARRLEQLGEHPQIPTLLAYFKEDNRLYLVQQFIDGQNLLKELEQQGTFNERKIRDLLQDLLSILQVVHQQNVIHRDIKPENIIHRGDTSGKGEALRKVVLIDFGASKQLTKTVMTAKGTMIGSFGYAPLEQMQGGEAYPASDLYSLGATCFHLLSGIHPWELWKTQAYGWIKSWKQHLQQPVSRELGKIIDKLLQEDYQQRYQSVEEVLKDLNPQLILSIQPVKPIVTPSAPQRQRKVFTSLTNLQKVLIVATFIVAAIITDIWVKYTNISGVSTENNPISQPTNTTTTTETITPTKSASNNSSESIAGIENLPRLEGKATVVMTVKGSPITIEVDGLNAPITAGNFVDLVQRGVYDGLSFHRVVRDPQPFVAQGGDPQSKDPRTPDSRVGNGGYIDEKTGTERFIPLEIKPKGSDAPIYGKTLIDTPVLNHKQGAVAMARGQQPDSGSSQFYFALADLGFLDGNYAVFGYVIKGFDVVNKIKQGDRIDSAKVTKGAENLKNASQ
ncbi:protein kinase [Calothrix sp. NIES-2100]|uniref:peptidylprolyl isomerase n=1 Tax=Calothrix sp. NIES-2100 TaxID=1954172 RepID=UPI000B60BE3D|nr:protein kinase [Calothrix sp. NIES-2100]